MLNCDDPRIYRTNVLLLLLPGVSIGGYIRYECLSQYCTVTKAKSKIEDKNTTNHQIIIIHHQPTVKVKPGQVNSQTQRTNNPPIAPAKDKTPCCNISPSSHAIDSTLRPPLPTTRVSSCSFIPRPIRKFAIVSRSTMAAVPINTVTSGRSICCRPP